MRSQHHRFFLEAAAEQIIILKRTFVQLSHLCAVFPIKPDAIHIKTVIADVSSGVFDIIPTENMFANGNIKLMLYPFLLARTFHLFHAIEIE